jgi:hypothetical protein
MLARNTGRATQRFQMKAVAKNKFRLKFFYAGSRIEVLAVRTRVRDPTRERRSDGSYTEAHTKKNTGLERKPAQAQGESQMKMVTHRPDLTTDKQ